MKIRAIKTKKFKPPQDEILPEIFRRIKKIPEKSILAISSKIVSINKGRAIAIDKVKDKDRLISEEADFYIPRHLVPGKFVMHTLKKGFLIPSAGIDMSNANGYYLLWPKNLSKTVLKLYQKLKKHYQIKKFGIIICDSRTLPLRRGVTGIALAYFGFKPINDYRGKKDLFGNVLQVAQANIADSLATAGVAVMGEGREQTPLAILTDVPFVQFAEKFTYKKPYSKLQVPLRQDLFYPFLSKVKWRRGGRG